MEILKKADASDRRVFLSALIAGFVAHGFRLTNKFFCEDAFNYLESISVSWTVSIGRFLLPMVEKARGAREATWLIGLLSLFYIALAAVLVRRIFDIKDKTAQCLLAAVMAAVPSVTGTFAFMYTADGYFFGMLMAVAAAYVTLKKDDMKHAALGGVCLAVSLAFYQAYLSVTIVLFMTVLFLMLLDAEKSVKEILKKSLYFLACGVTGLLIYFPGMKLSMMLLKIDMINYMGIADSKGFSMERIIRSFKNSYIEFARYYLVRWKPEFYNISNVLLFIIIAVLSAVLLFKKKSKDAPLRAGLICILMLLLPVATHIFFFISPDVSYLSVIMGYSMCFVYIVPFMLAERFNIKDKAVKYIRPVLNVFIFLIVFHFAVISNEAYEKMYLANKNTENEINRILARMEAMPGYTEDMDVAIFGNTYDIPEYVESAPMMLGVSSGKFLTSESTYISAMNWFCATDHRGVGKKKKKKIVASEEFAQMPMWPAEGAVNIIDGVMVVFLDDTGLDDFR